MKFEITFDERVYPERIGAKLRDTALSLSSPIEAAGLIAILVDMLGIALGSVEAIKTINQAYTAIRVEAVRVEAVDEKN